MLLTIQVLRASHSLVDFGGLFAYMTSTPMGASQVREKKMAKKTLKKSKKLQATKNLWTFKPTQ
jgi:hypothetical protein